MATTNGDAWVKGVQNWYNATYAGKTGYVAITADGIVGPGTCSALVRALQIELGVSGPNGNFGPGTIRAFNSTGITPQTTNSNLIRILQGGFICKGIDCGGFDGIYGEGLAAAVSRFKEYTGIGGSGNIDAMHMKALLNTDPFVLSSSGETYIRVAQQYLNSGYSSFYWQSIGLIPTNGIADRNMVKALTYALQYEEAAAEANGGAVSTGGIDGIVGTNTLDKAPVLSIGSTKAAFVKILQIAIAAMCHKNVGLDGSFDASVQQAVSDFQSFMCLTLDASVTSGIVCRKTWAALLISKGDVSRTANACDCSQQLTLEMARGLAAHGYQYVGRYLTGTVSGNKDKFLTLEEIAAITEAGLKIFAIFQDGGASSSYFNYNRGYADAKKACDAAQALNIRPGEIIYFAVDYDFMEKQTQTIVKPHFQGIHDYFTANGIGYRIGIYASRNICSIISDAGLACSSFVADMSTGYSGNMGYPLPDNWAFDQFHEYTFTGYGESGGSFDLDKDMASGRYTGFDGNTLHCWGNSTDVTKHDMHFTSHGTCKCAICGYEVLAPESQDKNILEPEKYLTVRAGLALFVYYSVLNANAVQYSEMDTTRMLLAAIQRIRAEHPGEYQYSDAQGICQIPPYRFTPASGTEFNEYNFASYRIRSGNLGMHSGVIPTIFNTLGSFFSPKYGWLMTIDGISNFVNNPSQLSATGFLESLLSLLVSAAELDEIGYLLSLIDIGISVQESGAPYELEIGDYVVEYPITNLDDNSKVVFNADGKIKAFVTNDWQS